MPRSTIRPEDGTGPVVQDEDTGGPPAGPRDPPRYRGVATVLGVVAAIACGAALVLRLLTTEIGPLVQAAAFAPLALVAGPTAIWAFAYSRRRVATAVGGALSVLIFLTQLPLFVMDTPHEEAVTAPLVVLQANLRVGGTDPDALIDLVREHHVDVLTVDELTQAQLDGLVVGGLERELPYEAARPAGAAAGTGVWSRRPMTSVGVLAPSTFHSIVIRTSTPAGVPVTVVAAHPTPPIDGQTAVWNDELTRLGLQLAGLAQSVDGSIVVGADLNATWDVAQFRELLTDGFADAAEVAGTGLLATYPTGRHLLGAGLPPLLALDHVLVRGADVAGVDTVTLPGSDHRGVLATLLVPTGEVTVTVTP